MSSLETLVGTLGFPIAVSVFLLYERHKLREKEIETNKNYALAVNDLRNAINELIEYMKGERRI